MELFELEGVLKNEHLVISIRSPCYVYYNGVVVIVVVCVVVVIVVVATLLLLLLLSGACESERTARQARDKRQDGQAGKAGQARETVDVSDVGRVQNGGHVSKGVSVTDCKCEQDEKGQRYGDWYQKDQQEALQDSLVLIVYDNRRRMDNDRLMVVTAAVLVRRRPVASVSCSVFIFSRDRSRVFLWFVVIRLFRLFKVNVTRENRRPRRRRHGGWRLREVRRPYHVIWLKRLVIARFFLPFCC